MVRILTVLGIVRYNALAGRIFASTNTGGRSMLCMDRNCDMRQDVVCRRCRDV